MRRGLVRALARGLTPLARAGAACARRGARALEDGRPAPPRRVLLVACAWIGDTFWATQVVPRLRAALPGAELHAATRGRSAGLWPDDVRVHAIEHVPSDRRREPASWRGILREGLALRALDLDVALDLTGSRYSAALIAVAGPRLAIGFDGDLLAGVYGRLAAPGSPGEHLSARPMRVVDALTGGRPADAGRGPVDPPQAAPAAPWEGVAAAHGLPADAPLALLAPGAGWEGKRWPAERFAALAGALEAQGLAVVVSGSAGEAALVARVVAGARAARPFVGTGVRELAALAARARLVVSNDSATAHLAAAAGTPVVALFGPTNPVRYAPLGPRVTVLRHACPERPEGAKEHCHATPAYPCPASCWDELSLERVRDACRAALVPT